MDIINEYNILRGKVREIYNRIFLKGDE